MLGRQENQPGLAELYLWSGKNKPLVDEGSFYDRFAKLRPSLLRDEDFIHWYVEGKGRPYKLLRRALHLVVKAHEKKLPKEL